MNRFDDLDDEARYNAGTAVREFLQDGGYEHLAAAMEDLGMGAQELWFMIMRDAGLPESVPPFMIQIAYEQ